MGTELAKEEPTLKKMRAAALRLQHKGNVLSPGLARGEQVCVSSRDSVAEKYGRKELFLIVTLAKEPEVYSQTCGFALSK